mmetsp:Transcript_46644/g.149848  ORF Transcript_46644/g.149848 Transcript_46644/m.149848 type:complete len:150 (-) Transcript_46644:119-568(-)
MTALVHSAFSICRGSGLKTCLLDHRRRPWPCFFPWPFRDTLCGRSQTQALHDFSAALLRTVDHDLVLLASALPLKVFTLESTMLAELPRRSPRTKPRALASSSLPIFASSGKGLCRHVLGFTFLAYLHDQDPKHPKYAEKAHAPFKLVR